MSRSSCEKVVKLSSAFSRTESNRTAMGRYGDVMLVQTSRPAGLKGENELELNGINLVTLRADWKRNGVKVAADRFDGFWEDDLDIWDTAAGMLLVKEAGGFVSDYRGQDRMFERRQYLAANGELHSKLHKLLAGALR